MPRYSVILRSCPHELTYSSKQDIPLGSLVSVPFRQGVRRGIICGRVNAQYDIEIKEIEAILRDALLETWHLEMISRISEYYFCSASQASRLYLPSFLWNEKGPKREEYLKMGMRGTEGIGEVGELGRSKKQRELVEILQTDGKMDMKDTKKMFSTSVIKAVLNKKIAQIKQGRICPGMNLGVIKPSAPKQLTKDQQKVFDSIVESREQRFLIHGITGSGKTEIYLQLVQKMLSEGKGAIILVPEIALTTQLIQYFVSHVENDIAVLHSKMTDQERAQEWWRLRTGEAKVLLASRSGLFAPVQNLGLVIIDEEHEWTYKQDNAPRYHARKVAEMMAEVLPDVKLVLGSATPSVETYVSTEGTGRTGRTEGSLGYELLELSERVGGTSKTALPEVQIVDLRDEFKKKNYSIFSDALQEALTETLENGEQAILFLNRRGSASAVVCRECGYTAKCDECEIAMTLHARAEGATRAEGVGGMLICHHCGAVKKPVSVCPNCRSAYIKSVGIGTERVERELAEMFPKARILRADKDTTSTKKGFEKIYHQFKEHEADILIGTQMIAKGLDIPHVSLVGVMLADIGLHIPDFRSSEKTFQLLTQVAGRAGRRDKQGQVIIQTYSPTHPAIVAASKHDYKKFFEAEVTERKTFGYPPFVPIIKLTYQDADKQTCYRTTKHVYETLFKLKEDMKFLKMGHGSNERERIETDEMQALEISMAPAAIPRLHGKYRWHIYLQGEGWTEILKEIQLERGWKIDRDPVSMG